MEMTFDEYDELVEKFEKIKGLTYWPSVDDIDLMNKHPDKFVVFASYLLETNDIPRNNDEKYSKKNLNRFVNSHLELLD